MAANLNNILEEVEDQENSNRANGLILVQRHQETEFINEAIDYYGSRQSYEGDIIYNNLHDDERYGDDSSLDEDLSRLVRDNADAPGGVGPSFLDREGLAERVQSGWLGGPIELNRLSPTYYNGNESDEEVQRAISRAISQRELQELHRRLEHERQRDLEGLNLSEEEIHIREATRSWEPQSDIISPSPPFDMEAFLSRSYGLQQHVEPFRPDVYGSDQDFYDSDISDGDTDWAPLLTQGLVEDNLVPGTPEELPPYGTRGEGENVFEIYEDPADRIDASPVSPPGTFGSASPVSPFSGLGYTEEFIPNIGVDRGRSGSWNGSDFDDGVTELYPLEGIERFLYEPSCLLYNSDPGSPPHWPEWGNSKDDFPPLDRLEHFGPDYQAELMIIESLSLDEALVELHRYMDDYPWDSIGRCIRQERLRYDTVHGNKLWEWRKLCNLKQQEDATSRLTEAEVKEALSFLKLFEMTEYLTSSGSIRPRTPSSRSTEEERSDDEAKTPEWSFEFEEAPPGNLEPEGIDTWMANHDVEMYDLITELGLHEHT